MSSRVKQIIFWLVVVASVIVFYQLIVNTQARNPQELSYNETISRMEKGEFTELVQSQSRLELTDKNNNKFFTTIEASNDSLKTQILNQATSKGVKISIDPGTNGAFWGIVLAWLPALLFIGFWIFMFRQMQAGGNKALSFGKSRAKLLNNQQKRVTFKDVAGIDEAKDELQEIIEFLKDPQKFQKLGGRIPKGVLMMGPPGTGKTLLARAVAGEANVPFFSISGSDFVEMFVGVGASRVRDLFEQGKKNAPCIIFIDEIDAVGRHRGAGLGGGHDEREQTLNQLLVEMDGFESNEGVILMASTNRPDVLDPALLRPGRFDRRVVVSRPDVRGREGILKVHTRKIPLDDNVDVSVIARGTPGFTGADLANLVNEAALSAARQNKKVVGQFDFEMSKDKVMMGAERRSMVITDQEKRVTAYHEAGHAIVGMHIPAVDPVHKVTIIPRGMALGVTMYLPERDRLNASKDYLLGQIATAMGGRIAEDIFIGTITTGASNDLERSTEVARAIVCQYGMSDLGPLTYGKKEEQIFLGREIAQNRDFSEDTAIKIDQEVRKLVTQQYDLAYKIISENREEMIRLAEALLIHETLDSVQIRRVVAGLPLDNDTGKVESTDDINRPQIKEALTNTVKSPLLPPLSGNNPATA
ncbi:MAG: ATP-dependent metallopeptidase FtsH/Yme1/Tma family protein [Pyrinomonadaceae bacterium]|nr:ATP-dependent metallopeptidase FtsH/Yme1/Tma family protein [Pyrinomonadaceae bacterium]